MNDFILLAKKKYKDEKKISSKEVVEYVCWLADANVLYEFALATYNLDLVVLIAQQTQKVQFL